MAFNNSINSESFSVFLKYVLRTVTNNDNKNNKTLIILYNASINLTFNWIKIIRELDKDE